jgi:hypothetical protein
LQGPISSVSTGSQRMKLVGKIGVKFAPQSIFDQDMAARAIFPILMSPPRIVLDQRLFRGAPGQLPHAEVVDERMNLRPIISRRVLQCGHLQPQQPLGAA